MLAEFTRHGELRAFERLSLPLSDVKDLLNRGLYVSIGKEAGSNKVHRLFYSRVDNLCFVAIQDDINGEIITILPIDYHEDIAWKISIHAQYMARDMILNTIKDQSSTSNLKPKKQKNKPSNIPPSIFYFKGFFSSIENTIKIKNLGSFYANDYDFNMDYLLQCEKVRSILKDKIQSISSNGLSLKSLYVHLGKEGKRHYCDLDL